MRTVVLDSGVTSYDMMGLSLTSSYIITIACIFTGHPIMDCGRSNIRTSLPDVIINSKVYRRLEVAGTWSRSQAECEAAGGHLASLGHDVGVEVKIMETVGVSDWWTGGNICPDSPGGFKEKLTIYLECQFLLIPYPFHSLTLTSSTLKKFDLSM